MSTLRKACKRCTVSKRRCVIQKPKCVRCLQKNLECVYDLEPLNAPPSESEKVLTFGFNLSSQEALGRCIITALILRPFDTDPAICAPGHENAVEITRLGFNTVPDLIRARKPALFVHPMLQLPEACDRFAPIVKGEANSVCCESFQHLVQIDIKIVPFKEVLSALQALLVHVASSVFSPLKAEQDEAEKALTTVSVWTQALLARVDAGVPISPSPWQNWLLGESVRRTIFMSYVLNLSVFGYKYGYCPNWLFMESLPFDSRPGLWMAESPQAWIAVANARSGEEVGVRLKSYHEFAKAFNGRTPDFCGDRFLKLVSFAHNGLGGN